MIIKGIIIAIGFVLIGGIVFDLNLASAVVGPPESDLCGPCQGDDACSIGACENGACYCSDRGLCKLKTGITICSSLGIATWTDKIGELVKRIMTWLLKISFVVAPVMIIIAGLLFYRAGGDAARIGLAKKIILWTVIGFMTVLFSNALGSIINYILGR